MPVQTITTKLALDGEAAFKREMSAVNASLRAIRSELKLSEAQFRGQETSVAALTDRDRLLRQEIEQQTAKVQALEQAMRDAAAAYGETDRRTADFRGQLARARADLINMNSALNENGAALREAQDRLARAIETPQSAVDGLVSAVRETQAGAAGASEAMDGLGTASAGLAPSIGSLSSLLGPVVLGKALKETAALLKDCTDASMDFESAMAGIQKVTKMSEEDLGDMAEEIKAMSTQIPATTGEIAAVVEASARLGVAREALLDFSRVMLDLGESSDMGAEEAATALARFANIAGTSAEDFERLGSTIVALGNNMATSESEITNMASRLASAGTLAGLSEAQIMALSAAMTAVGIEAEAGGTAMTQTLAAMEKAVTGGGDKLSQFARIAGMSAQTFSAAWRDDPITAIQAFIGGLSRLDEAGESATLILDELGLSGVRQSNMLKSLALASGELDRALDLASTAWAENTELAETAAARYETAESRTAMLKNSVDNLKIAVGDMFIPVLVDLADAGTKAFSWLADAENRVGSFSQALAGVSRSRHEQTEGFLELADAAEASAGAAEQAEDAAEGLAASSETVASGAQRMGSTVENARAEVDAIAVSEEEAGTAAEDLGASMEETGQAIEAAGEAAAATQAELEAMEKATVTLYGAADTLSKALKEQTETGSLSVKTALDLIDAGYGAALAVDTETGAVTLNRERYVELTAAKIDDQIAALETQRQAQITAAKLEAEALAALGGGRAYYELAAAKLYAEKSDTTAIDVQIANLERLRGTIGQVSGGVVNASGKVKTQAQRDLEEYKRIKAELDHLKAVSLVDEHSYYQQLAEARDKYLTAEDNVSEYRKVTEQIYKYDKSLVEREVELWEEQSESLLDQLEDRAKAVTAAQDRMEDKLSGYGDLFTVKDDRMGLESLQKQIDAIDRYEAALESLRGRGVSESLMDEVLGMDVDRATEYANKLLAMSESQWEQYNGQWEEKQRRSAEVAEKFFKDQMAALENEYVGKLGSALDNLTDTSFDSGVDTAQGLINGLASMEEALYAKAYSMAGEVARILRIPSNAEVASYLGAAAIQEPPAGVTAQDLRDTGAALVNGMQAAAAVPSGDLKVTFNVNGKEFYTETIEDFRAVNRANPEVMDDK